MGLRLVDIGWVAGIIEGEGSFYINRFKYKNGFKNPSITIRVGMTDKDVIDKLEKLTGMGNTVFREIPSHKTMYYWEVGQQKDAAALMMTLYPLMSERRQGKIRECLTAWRSFQYRHLRPCPQGHDTNEFVYYNGERNCKICKKESAARVRWNKKYF